MGESGFASTRLADNSKSLAGFDMEIEVLENVLSAFFWIGKGDVFEVDVSSDLFKGDRSKRLSGVLISVEDF